MLDSILEAISQLKIFILVAGLGIIITGVVLLIVCKDFALDGTNKISVFKDSTVGPG